MTNTIKALSRFFRGFDIPVYMTGNIPDNAQMPYITVDVVEPEPLRTAMLNASVWYRDEQTTAISAKVDQIKAAIGNGLSIPVDGGVVYIFRSTNSPFAQLMNDPNRETKRAYLSMLIHCNTD